MDRETVLASRILIVDDQDANILLLERVLMRAGFRNYQALTDSRQVLEQFRVFQPDLILLDLMMPKLDGYAVMKQLSGWVADDIYIPILVITADASRAAKQKALSLGAKDFLTKPIDTTEATLRIFNLLETRLLYRQIQSSHELLIEHALESRACVLAAREKMERATAPGGISTEALLQLRPALERAAAAVENLVRMADANQASIRPPDRAMGVEHAPAI